MVKQYCRTVWRSAAALAAIGLLLATPIQCVAMSGPPPNPDFTCRLKHRTTTINSLRRYPPRIRTFIARQFEPMADRGQPYNNTDAVTRPAPFARFIRGGRSGPYWFLWYEHGGIAYWKEIVVFGDAFRPQVEVKTSSSDLCAETDRLLDRLK